MKLILCFVFVSVFVIKNAAVSSTQLKRVRQADTSSTDAPKDETKGVETKCVFCSNYDRCFLNETHPCPNTALYKLHIHGFESDFKDQAYHPDLDNLAIASSHCITIQFKLETKDSVDYGELRSCVPEKVDGSSTCDYIMKTLEANHSEFKVEKCDMCEATAIPCNNGSTYKDINAAPSAAVSIVPNFWWFSGIISSMLLKMSVQYYKG